MSHLSYECFNHYCASRGNRNRPAILRLSDNDIREGQVTRCSDGNFVLMTPDGCGVAPSDPNKEGIFQVWDGEWCDLYHYSDAWLEWAYLDPQPRERMLSGLSRFEWAEQRNA